MPELPEVETVRKALLSKLNQKRICDFSVFHNNVFQNQDISEIKQVIKGQCIKDIKRRGKWLIFDLDDYFLLSHLRMEGKFLYRNIGDKIEKHELVIFNINNEFELRYKDVRKFGKMHLIKKDDVGISPLGKLGYEPWDENLTSVYLLNNYSNKNISIKTLLLDQTIIAGIGNIYANEILFLSKINPYRKGKEISKSECQSIIENTRKVLSEAIKKGGTTIRSYTSQEGVSGLFQNSLFVHMKEKCIVCGDDISKDKINGRSVYFCRNCQNVK